MVPGGRLAGNGLEQGEVGAGGVVAHLQTIPFAQPALGQPLQGGQPHLL